MQAHLLEESRKAPKRTIIIQIKSSTIEYLENNEVKVNIVGTMKDMKKQTFEQIVLEFIKEQKEHNRKVDQHIVEQKEFNKKVDERLDKIESRLDILESFHKNEIKK